MTSPPLLVLNPNCTGWMTGRVVQQVQRRLAGRAAVDPLTVDDGPPVIDDAASFAAGATAAQRALPARLAERPVTGGVLLACFGDPGLEALRAMAAPRPVHGLAEAAMCQATARGLRFAVLTCGPAWVALLTQRAHDFGLADALSGVYALPVNGRALAEAPARWQGELQAAADRAAREGAQALVLGGAAFAGLGGLIDSPLPVIDAIDAATDALLRDGPAAWRTVAAAGP
ncbi:MAG: Asp/Glu racemase [Ideonella sp.]|nr:Asp/Glu racemase [Ideonella sp.]